MRTVYQLLKFINDVRAIRNGRVGRRIGRRVYGKATGSVARKVFG